MAHWVRFEHGGSPRFGTIEAGIITVHEGCMFSGATATSERLPLEDVRILMPATPSKMIALWNNFRALGAKLGVPEPAEPLYLLKAGSSFLDPDRDITRPASYDGTVVYEGELGIVIGSTCKEASEEAAEACIFGYTCVNDVTAADIIQKDPTFAQWARAKSFDGFGPFGPVIATGVRPHELWVKTVLNGVERQCYPIADMVFPVPRLVSRLSHDMTLNPGDVICCGTSVGVGAMRQPSNTVEVAIEGIGSLKNRFLN